MGDGTKENPYTREDVLRLIKEHDGTAKGLDLSGKVFKAGIDLSGLNLEGLILDSARFPVAFKRGANTDADTGAQLQQANLMYAILKGASLRFASLQKANLSRANLRGTNLSGANLEGASLYGFQISSDTQIEDTGWGKDYKIGEENNKLFAQAVAPYRQLKVWYTNAGISDIAAKFYYREMEARRKALKWCSEDFCHRLYTESMRALFGYGERWRNILIWMAAFLILFAAAYYFGGKLGPLDSLYFSAVSFTALGYGRWALKPIGWVKGLGALEAFVGVFMMALLLVTFFRKWTR
jgi:hypothetical protein